MSDSDSEIAGRPDELAAVLHAAGAYPGLAEEMKMFGLFIGDWDEQMFIRCRTGEGR